MEVGIPITEDLKKYLGTQLVHGGHGKGQYIELLERYKARMERWKSNCLSLAGRITFAKSVISSLLIYQMQGVILQEPVLKDLNRMARK